MIAYYVNVADEIQPQDIQVVHSTVDSTEEPLSEGYDFRRALATTICEKVLTKYNLEDAVITVSRDSGDVLVRLVPLKEDPEWIEDMEDMLDDGRID